MIRKSVVATHAGRPADVIAAKFDPDSAAATVKLPLALGSRPK